MNSNAAHVTPILFQASDSMDKGSVQAALYENGQYRILGLKAVLKLTPQDLCNGPYVFRFDIPGEGKVYFVGTDEAYLKLQSEGKMVRWFHDLFEAWRQDLVRQGLPPHTSIYCWALEDIYTFLAAFQVFPGAKVVYQGAVGSEGGQ